MLRSKTAIVGVFCLGLLPVTCLLAGSANAAEPERVVPSIARVEGKVAVLTPPTAGQTTGLVSVQGKTYASGPAQLGMMVPGGSVIQTGPDGKARLVYPGGDYLSVSPNSMFRIFPREAKKRSVFDLMSGKVRALMTKKAEGEEVELRSRTAIMGVRGTDFYVAAWSEEGGSQVTVFRGAVAVSPRVEEPVVTTDAPVAKSAAPAPAPKPVMVTAGVTATQAAPAPLVAAAVSKDGKVAPPPAPPAAPVMRQTTKQELVVIQKESTVVRAAAVEPKTAKPEDMERLKKLDELERKASEATVSDIKKYDPELYKKVAAASNKGIVDADQVQALSVKKIFEKAPNAEGKIAPEAQKAAPKKPTLKDLELPDDVYRGYQGN